MVRDLMTRLIDTMHLGRDRVIAWLDEWGPLARDLSTEDFAARVEARMRAETSDEAAA
jgi:hypothetical protein